MKQRMYVLVTLIVVSTLFLSGCTSSSISGSNIKDITTNPGKYEGSSVSVSGKVIEVIPNLPAPDAASGGMNVVTLYKINDGSDSIYIKSITTPKIGDQVTVKGIVFANAKGVYVDTTATK